MHQEQYHWVWPSIVSIAFIVHYVSSTVNMFKEAQDTALDAYASKSGKTFSDRKELEKHMRNDKNIIDNKIVLPPQGRNTYVAKTLTYYASCLVVAISAIFFEFTKLSEHSKLANNPELLKHIRHNIIGYSCFIFLFFVTACVAFSAFKYFTRDEKVTAINGPVVKYLYRWMPYLDEFAFAVVVGEFALFWFE
ncbi:hypothetical protein [Gluconobacter sp. Gdi]|uniref:hypothetical protein n=1 Tax=Gluconobacter sp. Gdi TaxID=2691888 RepID=UPI00176E05C3|nr:hypothetical protein [Gluconobacter sp. Gdi]GFE97787.1 hypothetical protein DmGdi_28600 [Gluconobacter sp. Gdi]